MKRKLPDFLNNVHWNKKKSQKWLKNYPYLKSNLHQIQRLIKTTKTNLENSINWFKRLYFLINVLKMNQLYSCSIFKFANITNVYMTTIVFNSLLIIEGVIVYNDNKINQICNQLLQKNFIIPIGFEFNNFKEIFVEQETKLNNLSFYCDRFIMILKQLQNCFDTNFDTSHIIPKPIEINKIQYISIKDETHLNQLKKLNCFDFYQRNTENLFNDFAHDKKISDICFLDFLKIETQTDYQLELIKNIGLLIKYHIPIYNSIQINSFSFTDLHLILRNGLKLKLLERFQWRLKKTKDILFSYLFSNENTIILIPDVIPILTFPHIITNLILRFYLEIKIFPFSDIELV